MSIFWEVIFQNYFSYTFFLYKKQNFKNKIFIISIFSILIFAYFLVFMTGERSSFFLLNLSMIIMLIFYFNLKNLIIFSFIYKYNIVQFVKRYKFETSLY